MIRFLNLIDGASLWLARLSAVAVVLMAAGFIVALLAQVVFRYVLNIPLSWSEELATFLFVWSTLLAASYGVRRQEHLRLTFLQDVLPPTAGRALNGLCQALIAVFGLFLIKEGWRLAELVWTNTSAAIGYPVGYLYISVPIAGGMIALHALGCIARLIADNDTTLGPTP
ncbi:TRAP transporter small permease [Arenibacterium halophilum]|uniref:TRAP transporter small permease protein n=1 Tax=Arenibacterium halophilum TaxID=2583821 RepID=A0ABY2WZ96_9RHOB|nr:TRAP transporter small permease [Arenibacterium halophilum]TMV08277.1 TRAP transporter small permease [Arenibacterium halophilum]